MIRQVPEPGAGSPDCPLSPARAAGTESPFHFHRHYPPQFMAFNCQQVLEWWSGRWLVKKGRFFQASHPVSPWPWWDVTTLLAVHKDKHTNPLPWTRSIPRLSAPKLYIWSKSNLKKKEAQGVVLHKLCLPLKVSQVFWHMFSSLSVNLLYRTLSGMLFFLCVWQAKWQFLQCMRTLENQQRTSSIRDMVTGSKIKGSFISVYFCPLEDRPAV